MMLRSAHSVVRLLWVLVVPIVGVSLNVEQIPTQTVVLWTLPAVPIMAAQ